MIWGCLWKETWRKTSEMLYYLKNCEIVFCDGARKHLIGLLFFKSDVFLIFTCVILLRHSCFSGAPSVLWLVCASEVNKSHWYVSCSLQVFKLFPVQTISRCIRTKKAFVIQYIGKWKRRNKKLKSYSNVKIRRERMFILPPALFLQQWTPKVLPWIGQ